MKLAATITVIPSSLSLRRRGEGIQNQKRSLSLLDSRRSLPRTPIQGGNDGTRQL